MSIDNWSSSRIKDQSDIDVFMGDFAEFHDSDNYYLNDIIAGTTSENLREVVLSYQVPQTRWEVDNFLLENMNNDELKSLSEKNLSSDKINIFNEASDMLVDAINSCEIGINLLTDLLTCI